MCEKNRQNCPKLHEVVWQIMKPRVYDAITSDIVLQDDRQCNYEHTILRSDVVKAAVS